MSFLIADDMTKGAPTEEKMQKTRRVFPCLFYLLNTSTELLHGRITARYSTLDEKHAFASLAMFDMQYLIKE